MLNMLVSLHAGKGPPHRFTLPKNAEGVNLSREEGIGPLRLLKEASKEVRFDKNKGGMLPERLLC